MKKTNGYLTGTDLINKVDETIEKAEQVIKENNWQVKGEIKILKCITNGHLDNCSKRTIKRLNKAIWFVEKKPGLNSINRLFHFICTRVLETKERVRVLPSQREIEIQEARKRWKEVKKVEQELLDKYKELKGDFYK